MEVPIKATTACLHVDAGETTQRYLEGRAYPPGVEVINPVPRTQGMCIMRRLGAPVEPPPNPFLGWEENETGSMETEENDQMDDADAPISAPDQPPSSTAPAATSASSRSEENNQG
eukprot:6491684-Amphidinium_carterae.2